MHSQVIVIDEVENMAGLIDKISLNDKNMNETKISIKVGKQTMEVTRETFFDAQENRHRISPSKRELLMKEIQEKHNGKLSPGMVYDMSLDEQVQQLDKEFRHINFGMKIDHDTFEKIRPSHIDKEKDITAYREWKKCAIIFKREQLELRMK